MHSQLILNVTRYYQRHTSDLTLIEAVSKPSGKGRGPCPDSGEFYKYNAPFNKTRPLSEQSQRTTRRANLACVRYVDRQVGKVLGTLDELGLAESTIVFAPTRTALWQRLKMATQHMLSYTI